MNAANSLLSAAFTEVRHTITDQVAEGDKVMTRVTVRGTFSGDFLGYRRPGRRSNQRTALTGS